MGQWDDSKEIAKKFAGGQLWFHTSSQAYGRLTPKWGTLVGYISYPNIVSPSPAYIYTHPELAKHQDLCMNVVGNRVITVPNVPITPMANIGADLVDHIVAASSVVGGSKPDFSDVIGTVAANMGKLLRANKPYPYPFGELPPSVIVGHQQGVMYVVANNENGHPTKDLIGKDFSPGALERAKQHRFYCCVPPECVLSIGDAGSKIIPAHPHACPDRSCGMPALVMFNTIECTNPKCRHHR